jgi:outer membrane protein OmpA-like peptidoglycan-associated protein
MSTPVQIPAKPVAKPVQSVKPKSSSTVLRRCACGGAGGAGGECEDCGKKRLQRSAWGHSPEFAPPIVHDVLRAPGVPLDSASRSYFEPRFGHDFSKVRIHADERASESAQSVNALAYTVGPHIAFASGLFQPRTASGQRLLAHELTHVVQQQGSSTPASSLRVGPAADAHEQEAQRSASAIGEEELSPEQHAPESVQRQAASSGPPLGTTCATIGNPGASPDPPGSTPTPEHCPAPADMPCTPSGDPVKGATSSFVFLVNSSDLDTAKPTPGKYATVRAEIEAVAETWKTGGASGKIRIDGYASAEYYCVYNWCLSCRRAEAVADEFKNHGIDGSNLEVHAHGESNEAGASLAENRRATISLPAGPGPQPTPTPDPEPAPTPWTQCLKDPNADKKCCEYRQQLLNTADRWLGEGYQFAGVLLRYFVTEGHSEDAGSQFQDYAKEIADSSHLKIMLDAELAIAARNRLKDVPSANLADEPHVKFNVEYYLPPTNLDLLYALGGAHFEVTGGTIYEEPSLWNRLVSCKYQVDNLEWVQRDDYTFPHGWLREQFDDYKAAEYLEEHCGHKSFRHYETWTEAKHCVAS